MKTMALASVLFLIFACTWHATVASAQQKPEDAARKPADAWLALTDSGKYAQSWDEASSFFKSKLAKDTWVGQLQKVRDPLGAVISRKLTAAKYMKNPPNAPDTEFVVFTFNTGFDQLPSAVETVSMFLEKDGAWRPAGYFIKPAAQ